MQLSWRMILAPWAGALAGWLAGHGLSLSSDQLIALVVLCAGGAANGLHVLEQWLSPRPPPTVSTVIKAADPAKKPPPGPTALSVLLPLLLMLPLLTSLSSCAALGLTPAASADESIAYGYGLYTALESALSSSLAAGEVTKSTAIAVDEKAGGARALLDAARAAETVNPSGAATDLASATNVLEALQAWLNHPSGSPP